MQMNNDSINTNNKLHDITIDKQFILKVVNKTTIYKGKNLLRNEVEGLIQYIKELDFNLMKNDHLDVIVDKISKNFVKQLVVKIDKNIDIHEVMKSRIGENDNNIFHSPNRVRNNNSIEYKYNERDKNNIISRNTGSDTKNLYLLLDSKYRNLSTDKSVFKWTVIQSANTTQGTVNTLSDQINDIVSIQFDRFSLPYTASADNVYKKITMYIEEFSSMSILINSGKRYHMIFDSDIQDNKIKLIPLINDEGRYRFHTPVRMLDTITLKFQSPFSTIDFLQDRFDVKITSSDQTQSLLTFTTPHQVKDGDLVHLERYSTLNKKNDIIHINKINDERGHIVTFINDLVLGINVDLVDVSYDSSNITVCFIASRRLIIPIRMEYLY
jgi:hypothetical protein